jgi:FkbM family methyltransferase
MQMRFRQIDFSKKELIFALHREGEYISDLICKEGSFYELEHLEILHYLPIKKNGLFIDIGANIGNHTLYYSKIMQREVYSFEPIKENFRLLKRNVFINGLEKKVKCFNFALSNKSSTVKMVQNYEHNSGTFSIVSGAGDIPTKCLDEMQIEEDVAYIKIDVEGQELNVLQGAKELIIKNKPIISTEYHFGDEFNAIDSFLSTLGYRAAFVAGKSSNAIFIHNTTMVSNDLAVTQNLVEQLRSRGWLTPHIPPSTVHRDNISKKVLTISKQQSYKNKTVKFDEKLLVEQAYVKQSHIDILLTNKVIEPDSIAKMIIEKLPKESKNILINFSDKLFDDTTSICIDKDYVISINEQKVFSDKISRKTLTDVIRYLQHYLKACHFLIVVDFQESLLELAHELFELNKVEYGVIVSEIIPLHWEKWSWLSNSRFIYTDDADIYKQFSIRYIFNIELKEKISIDKKDFTPYKAKISIDKAIQKKGLLISYYYEPALSVGIFRPSYWFNNINEISNGEISLELATAMRQVPKQDNLHVIPDYGTVTGITTHANIKKEHEAIKNMVNTVAFSWTQTLQEYFDAHPELEYDFVILTGNPFMHFYFSEYVKKKWDAVVIQDYRDPMGKNPRFYSKDPKITKRNEQLRQKYEDEFCSQANIVVTVNEYCAKDMSPLSPQPVEIIRNGYNDKVIDNIHISESIKEIFPKKKFTHYKVSALLSFIKKSKKRAKNNYVKRLCYAGSFAHDRKPENLIKSIKNTLGYELHHFGTPYPILVKSSNKRLISHGKKAYDDVIASMLCMDIGVVYCSHDFESTTKIYDYIACDMVILVITSPENPKPYTLSKELEGLDHVYWVVNTEEAITEFLANTTFAENIKRPQREQFSRKEGTKKLINLIKRKDNG